MDWESPLWAHTLLLIQWGVVLGASLVAAVWDVRTRRIPNVLTGPLCLSGFIFATWMGGFAGLGDSVLGCLLGGIPFVVLFAVAGAGAGDTKLMAGLGAWLGVTGGALLLVCVALIGWITGIALSLCRHRLTAVVQRLWLTVIGLVAAVLGHQQWSRSATPVIAAAEEQVIRYGVVILLGVIVAAIGRGAAYVW